MSKEISGDERARFEVDLLAYFAEKQPDRTLTLEAIKGWRGSDGDYAERPVVRGMWEGWQRCAALASNKAAAVAAREPIPQSRTTYAECRECVECGHIGINDEHATDAACGYACGWSGPSPVEDKCPDCQHRCMPEVQRTLQLAR
jgi:hypothetical protein